jgi:hypothetical protein
MSIELVTTCLSLKKEHLTSSEKHILTILCFRANKHHEAYSSIDRLINDCLLSKNTVDLALKELRRKGYLIYTGKIAPKSKRIPIYKINLITPTTGVIK